ncbi:MAG: flavodoxin domain-containing protein [Sandaracinaceae bacterium]
MEILLIVGSEMGNAEMVGDLVKDELEGQGHTVEMVTEGTVDGLGLADRATVLIISSTTGLGDVPQNVEPLYDELVASRPDLGRVRYGLVGMGDRNYKDTFCGGPRKWDAIFGELGARRVGDALLLDATDNPTPDQDAIAWLPSWLDLLAQDE